MHVHGTRATLEAARAAGVRRVVVASTSGIVGISESPDVVAIEDDEPPHGLIQRFPYYRSKLYAEQEAFEHNRDGLEVVCVNPSLLLGPGDVLGSSTHDVRLFLDRAVPFVPPGGLAYVDARDAAEAMLLAMERGRPGRRYLVSACNLTVAEFFLRLERLSGVPSPRVPMPRSREPVPSQDARSSDDSSAPWAASFPSTNPASTSRGCSGTSTRAARRKSWDGSREIPPRRSQRPCANFDLTNLCS